MQVLQKLSISTKVNILAFFLFLRKQTDQKIAFFIRIEGRWHDGIAARLQLETVSNFSSIDESIRASSWSMIQEIILVQTRRL